MRTRHVIALLALALTPALAACGGSSSHGTTTSAAEQPSGQLTAPSSSLDQSAAPASATTTKSAGSGTAAAGSAHKGPKVTSRPDPVSSKSHVAKGRHRARNEQRGTGIAPLNPCTLVTRAEAGKIVGQPIVGLRQAPQGPTCVYRARKTKSLITMAIQLMPFDPKKQRATDVTRVTLRGHKAYCVKRGSLAMLVPLAAGHVLNVTAPCPIAAGFASKALARLYP
jgi:hypothetical protein